MRVQPATSRVIRTFPRDDLAYVAWLSSLIEQKSDARIIRACLRKLWGEIWLSVNGI